MSESTARDQKISQPYGHAGQQVGAGLQGEWEAAQSIPKVRSIGMCILLTIVTFGIYGIFWLYFIHSENPRRRDVDPTPGKAVGFMFIPIFNYYWQFRVYLSLTDRMNILAVKGTGETQEPVSRGLCMTFLILSVCSGIVYLFAAFSRFPTLVGAYYVLLAIVVVLSIIWWVSVQKTANRLAEAALHAPPASV